MTSIVVGVRVRPFNQRELKYNSCNIVNMDPSSNVLYLKSVRQGKIVESEQPREFVFDHMLWTHDENKEPFADQRFVYTALGRRTLDNVLEGFNSCLFAYGQTGSGKTYSMMGHEGDAGVIPRLCDDLFAFAATLKDGPAGSTIQVECSYLEIYNELVNDLLIPPETRPSGGLRIRQHPKTGVFVENIKKFQVTTKEAVAALLEQGLAHRAVAQTNMNASSSRSHAVLLLTVTQASTTTVVTDGMQSASQAIRTGRLSLVDLAGSERASSTGATGETLAEGASINKSLTFLGMCLSRLADIAEGKTGLPVPYRDSSLTFLLSESLGGNSKTSMLANISPADINFEETLSTLRFAQVTKKVKNNAVVNESAATRLIRELKDELTALREQLHKYQETSNSEAAGLTAQQVLESEAAAVALESTAVFDETVTQESAAFCHENVVTLDWRKPTLVNLCPEGSSLALPLSEGRNFITLFPDEPSQEVTCTVASGETKGEETTKIGSDQKNRTVTVLAEYSSLLNSVTLRFQTVATTVAGKTLQDEDETAESAKARLRSRRGIDVSTLVPYVNGAAVVPEETHDENILSEETAVLAPTVEESVAEPAAAATLLAVPTEPPPLRPRRARARTILLTKKVTTVKKYCQVLVHGDRLVLGRVAFRLSHSSSLPTLREYSLKPRSVEHLAMVEERERHELAATRAREAKELLMPLAASVAAATTVVSVQGPAIEVTPAQVGEAPLSSPLADLASPQVCLPAGLDGFARKISAFTDLLSDSNACATNAMRRAEEALIAEAPVTLEEQQEAIAEWRRGLPGGTAAAVGAAAAAGTAETENEYAAVLAEQKKALEEKDKLIGELRTNIVKAAETRRKREMSFVRREDEKKVAEQRRKEEELMRLEQDAAEVEALNRAVEEELLWHTTLNRLRVASPEGPRDPVDRALWNSYATGALPFLQEISAAIKREHAAAVAAALAAAIPGVTAPVDTGPVKFRAGSFHKQSRKKKWEARFGVVHGHFLYYFRGPDGREQCCGAIYLYGATIVTSTQTDLGRPNCLLLTSPCPRRPGDVSSFYLAFSTPMDLIVWAEWITDAAQPPMPASMLVRVLEQRAQAGGPGSDHVVTTLDTSATLIHESSGTASVFSSPGTTTVAFLSAKDSGGVAGASTTVIGKNREHWKNDAATVKCEYCTNEFGFFRRRHHCRSCGGIYCDTCCPKRKGGASDGHDTRVCENCMRRESAATASVAPAAATNGAPDVVRATEHRPPGSHEV